METVDLKPSKNRTISTETKSKFFYILNEVFNNVYKYGFYALVCVLLGIYIGITTSKTFYLNKVDELIQVGAFLHNEQVYQILAK